MKMKNLRFYVLATILLSASAYFITRSVINSALVVMIDSSDEKSDSNDKKNHFYNRMIISDYLNYHYIIFDQQINLVKRMSKSNDRTIENPEVYDENEETSKLITMNEQEEIGSQRYIIKGETVDVSNKNEEKQQQQKQVNLSSSLLVKRSRESSELEEEEKKQATNYFDQLAKTKYKWQRSTRAYVQSSFFVGYLLLQLPAASYADKYGSKKFILFCMVGSAIITLITPFISSSLVVFIISRFIMGLVQSCMFPSCFVCLVNWLPLKDRTFGFAVLSIAPNLGSVIIYFISGFIIENLGWPYLFWISGLTCLIFTIFAAFFLTSKPEDHKLISDKELNIIKEEQNKSSNLSNGKVSFRKSCNGKKAKVTIERPTDSPGNRISSLTIDEEVFPEKLTKSSKRLPIPWLKILSNKPVIVTFILRVTQMSMFMLWFNTLPDYLDSVLHQSKTLNGIINAAVQFVSGFASISVGLASERLIERGFMERTQIRKFFAFICGFGQSLCLVFIPLAGMYQFNNIVITLIISSSFFCGFIAGAETPLPAEMSKKFGPTIFAINNIGAQITGIIVPNVVALVLNIFHNQTAGWYVVFYSSALIMTLATIPFMFWASAERQSFDFTEEELFQKRIRSKSTASWRYSTSL